MPRRGPPNVLGLLPYLATLTSGPKIERSIGSAILRIVLWICAYEKQIR